MKPPFKGSNQAIIDSEGTEILLCKEKINPLFISVLAVIMNENHNRLMYAYLGDDSSPPEESPKE